MRRFIDERERDSVQTFQPVRRHCEIPSAIRKPSTTRWKYSRVPPLISWGLVLNWCAVPKSWRELSTRLCRHSYAKRDTAVLCLPAFASISSCESWFSVKRQGISSFYHLHSFMPVPAGWSLGTIRDIQCRKTTVPMHWQFRFFGVAEPGTDGVFACTKVA